MEKLEFTTIMRTYLKQLKIELMDYQIEQFYKYMNILIEWNKVMNLTRIIEPNEIIIKHFIDSLTILKHINEQDSIIDVGTGAGFPGIPIKIVFPYAKVVLLDSLNKRINFLNEVIKALELDNITAIHGRAEDFGRDINYREKYDLAVARAVAPLNVLLEYLMPFVKVEGKCLCMKGSDTEKEILESQVAIDLLSGKLIETEEFCIPSTDMKRKIVEVLKIEKMSNKYPRKAGIISKEPLK